MLGSIVLIVHVAICGLIVGFVLLQRGKGAEAGTGFGAGASGTVFGARGSANFLSRTTAILATVFFVTSLALAYLATQRQAVPSGSLLERSVTTESVPQAQPPPAGAEELPPLDLPAGDGGTPPAAGDGNN